ncbi:CehA/McbA family metallohydrolase [Limnoglobus roseus]|uniref:EF-hand domain-containing protein n=1 Tax=Limnoglobus roseus TaxID=2598579 RepID=A0A5C1A879_9BACT|nr:CehA/McbA family metallohydrolase [Limnoglobus roseus]QEL14206.1 EF-hand domain-containing protein [Limnoglobus roseus]
MRLLSSLALTLALATALPAADKPAVVKEEGQPVAANAERVAKALAFLGTPLPPDLVKSLQAAVEKQDAAEIQNLLDDRVLFVVSISPEARVKVARGPAEAILQQSGWTPVLVKIVNEATIKKRLGIGSTQGGPVYSGQGRVAKDPKADPNTVKRFAQLEMFQSPPMTAELSGLKVEYAVALVYSSEAGKREITVSFDAGQGSQDLGFRAEVPVVFDIKPAIPVKLKVLDFDGTPTVGRFTFKDAAGHVYPPQAKRLGADLFFQQQIYRADGGTVLLPPGEFTVEYGRGPEYQTITKMIRVGLTVKTEIAPGVFTNPPPGTPATEPPMFEFKLQRWINPVDHGFYSGDHHIHAAGCAHYTNPTEGIMPEDMFLHVKGEGLNVGCCLTWGPCYDFQRKFFDAKPWERSEPFTVLKYDVEVSGFGSQALGHVNLLNLKDQTYPGSEGTKVKGWPTWTTPLMKWAKAQGGVTGYAHSANGLTVNAKASTERLFERLATNRAGAPFTKDEADAGLWPLPEDFDTLDADKNGRVTPEELRAGTDRQLGKLPNLLIPQMDGIGAQEICVTSALGVCDFISAMDTDRVAEWNCWYHVLNCGFPLKVSGETDFPCITGSRVGQGRVYVQLGKVAAVDYAAFCNAIAAGKSYVSDGYAHAFGFQVGNGKLGDTITAKAGTKLPVTAKVTFDPQMFLGTSVGGKQAPSDKRLVELVVNGKAVAKKEVPADQKLHDVAFDVTIDRSSWVAIRSFPQLHTNPVFVRVDDKPIRASRDSAKWCVGVIEQLWKVRKNDIKPAERAEAEKTFREAIEIYKKIGAEVKD